MNDRGSGGSGQGAGEEFKTQSSGFTLIEVLLAVSILAFIVSVIYGSFFTASRNVEQAEAIRDSTDLARTLISKISDDIQNAYCNPGMTATKTVFYGKRQEQETGGSKRRIDNLYLTTLTNWRKPNTKETELWEVGYFFKDKPAGDGAAFMRHEKRELTNTPIEEGFDYEITDKVVELHLRYLSGSNWLEEWGSSSQCRYPKAVEISLTLEDDTMYTTRVNVGNAQ